MTSRTVWFAVAASLFAPQSLIAQPDCPTQLCSNVRKMVADAGSRWKSFRTWDASWGWRPTVHVVGDACWFSTGKALQGTPGAPRSDADFAGYNCTVKEGDDASRRALWDQLILQTRIALPLDDWKADVNRNNLGGTEFTMSSRGLGTVTATLNRFNVLRFEIVPPVAVTSSTGRPAKPPTSIGVKDYYDLGRADFNKKEYDKAFENFNRFLMLEAIYNETDSSIVSASHYYKGWIYNERKQYEAAIRELDEAIKLDAKSARNFRERAYSYRQLQEWFKAIRDLDKSLALDPKNVAALLDRAQCRFNVGLVASAQVDYEAAAMIDPRNAEALYGRGAAKRLQHPILGDGAAGDADMAAAKLLQANIADVMARKGIKPGG